MRCPAEFPRRYWGDILVDDLGAYYLTKLHIALIIAAVASCPDLLTNFKCALAAAYGVQADSTGGVLNVNAVEEGVGLHAAGNNRALDGEKIAVRSRAGLGYRADLGVCEQTGEYVGDDGLVRVARVAVVVAVVAAAIAGHLEVA